MSLPSAPSGRAAAGVLRHQRGLTLIELLVAVVLSLAILTGTAAVTQMVVKRYQQLRVLEDQHAQVTQFKQRLTQESNEWMASLATTPQEWIFNSAWRGPGESWEGRQTRLACQQDTSSQDWFLVLSHRYPESANLKPSHTQTNHSAAVQEWGRVGPWSACEIQIGSLQPVKSSKVPKAEALVWESPKGQTVQGRVMRYRILLTDSKGILLPWVLHVR